MYRSVCGMLDTFPGQVMGSETAQVVMIGDSKRCDELGPRSFGIVGHHLDRKGAGGFRSLIEFTHALTQALR